MFKVFLYSIILFLSIFSALAIRDGWIEPDSYAFISRTCGNSDFETPIISKIVFDSIGCSKTNYFFYQALLWGISFFLVANYFKQKDFPIEAIVLMGFSLSVIYSILAIEDDYLLTGFLMVFTYWLFDKTSIKKIFLYGLFILIGGTFFWKGLFLIGAIILGGAINPFLAIIPIAYYVWGNGLHDWNGSLEATVFGGWTVFFPIIILLFFSKKEKILSFYYENKRFSQTFIALVFLGFFQIKWGFYSAIFLPIIFFKTLDKKTFNDICVVAGIIVLLTIFGLSLTKAPNSEHWIVLEKALKIQDSGGKIMVSTLYGFEKWGFEYLGGKTFLLTKDNNSLPYYYLGTRDVGSCEVYSKKDNLWVGYCIP